MPGDDSYCGEDRIDWTLLRTPLELDRLRADAPSYGRLVEHYSDAIDPADREETLTYILFPSSTFDASPVSSSGSGSCRRACPRRGS